MIGKITPQERATKLVLVSTQNYSAYDNFVRVHHTTNMEWKLYLHEFLIFTLAEGA
jgi:hypothetical protein